jgi:cation diffusion facilitator CzcD-associated flavoprotein CzcO
MELTARVLIIGTGFSGIALACALQKAGIPDVLLLEKADDVGGTWRENTYPGAECDVPSALYSFSFEHNPTWHYKWSEQRQILQYLRRVAHKHELPAKIRFGQEVCSAQWNESQQCWVVVTVAGDTFTAQFLVSGVGQLHRPAIPAIAGAESFSGPSFHSARWRHDVDLTGKRVAVIGNAASALQFIPQIAKKAAQVSVFQRSANWVLPKQDRAYLPFEQWLSDKIPWLTRLYRFRLWLFGELFLFAIMRGNRLLRWWGERETKRYLERTITDPELRRKLTPDYPIGAKRVLFSDDYYDAMARPNVELVTDGVAELTTLAVRCTSGREIAADVLIYGTGFHSNPFLAPMAIAGRGGRLLAEAWSGGAQAYLGMMTSGFPNLFMMYGPNTNLGHNSIVVMIEAQAGYVVQAIQGAEARGAKVIDVRPEVEAAYNVEMQQRLATMAWSQVAESWYKDRGRITNNWPGSTWEYINRTRGVDWRAYRLEGASSSARSITADA